MLISIFHYILDQTVQTISYRFTAKAQMYSQSTLIMWNIWKNIFATPTTPFGRMEGGTYARVEKSP